jgi:hypothetical protein
MLVVSMGLNVLATRDIKGMDRIVKVRMGKERVNGRY